MKTTLVGVQAHCNCNGFGGSWSTFLLGPASQLHSYCDKGRHGGHFLPDRDLTIFVTEHIMASFYQLLKFGSIIQISISQLTSLGPYRLGSGI